MTKRVLAASVSAVLLAAALPFTSLAAPESGTGWEEVDGKFYWYEDGVLQGYKPEDASYRGKEIYDEASDAWYWLDNDNGGAKAVSKDVYQESEAGQWGDVLSDGVRYGKWVRYDENGAMIKGWNYTDAGTYYFDLTYGTMAKGYATVDGVEYYFNTGDGTRERELGAVPEGNGWKTIDGADYWYENGVRQGYSVDQSYRGKEIYDPGTDAWYWLDNVDGGKKAVNKDVYQESGAGEWAENSDGTGKWVRYDENGHMIKGWSTTENGTYYFDPIYGTMAKGTVTIDGVTYKFDSATGICEGETESGDDGKPDDGNTDDGNTGEEKVRNIEWSISDDGLLTVTGECGSDGLLWDGQDSYEYYRAPWYTGRKKITSAYVNVSGVKNMCCMFYECENLTSLDLGDLDTSGVTDMSGMFEHCLSLTSLDLSDLDTSSVTDMYYMFRDCESLTSLDLSNFDTSSVTDMHYMFDGCESLTSLDLSNFDTSSVTDMQYMFYECESLTSLDLRSFDTSNVLTRMSMFKRCRNLGSIYVGSGWTAGGGYEMFYEAGVSEVTYV